MSFKAAAMAAITMAGGYFAAGYYGISLDPRSYMPIDSFCYVEDRVLHIEQTNSFNIERIPKVTKAFKAEIDRNRIHVSDSYSPEGAALRDIEMLVVTPETIEITVRPGVLRNIDYVFRSPDPGCANVIRDYFAMSHVVLPRIYD